MFETEVIITLIDGSKMILNVDAPNPVEVVKTYLRNERIAYLDAKLA